MLGISDTRPRRVFGTVILPVTWRAANSLVVHANVGRDQVEGMGGSARLGAAVEWTPSPTWSFVAERFKETDANLWRLGVRRVVAPSVTLDVSRADGLRAGPSPWWTVGLTWQPTLRPRP